MNKPWKVIFAFLGVFLAGAVFGGFLTLRVIKEKFHQSPSMDRFNSRILTRYADRLELSPDQLDQIRPIVTTAETELRRVRSAGFKATIAIAEKMNEQVAKVLTPEQMTRLEELKMEMNDRWRKDRTRRGGDRPPHGEPRPHDGPPPNDL